MTDNPQRLEQYEPIELLIHDDREVCPYLPGQVARMPLRLPTTKITPEQFDQRMSQGDRRSGLFLYRADCPACKACEPIRIRGDEFLPSRSQSRVLRRGQRMLETELGPLIVDRQRVDLFNAHRRQRGLAGPDGDIDASGYETFLVDSCCDSFEIRYRLEGQLVAVAVCDQGEDCISAVYCYFDPAFSHLSLGTFSILTQVDLTRRWRKQFLYLGLYIAESHHMSYKSGYRPHERMINGRWRRFGLGEVR